MLPYTTCLREVSSGGTQHSRLVIAFCVTKRILLAENTGTRNACFEGRGFDMLWATGNGVIQSVNRGSRLSCRCVEGSEGFSTKFSRCGDIPLPALNGTSSLFITIFRT
jgi:hypothetical protein